MASARIHRKYGPGRPCRVCGETFRPSRYDQETCTDRCRQRRHRGGDLAYLAGLDPVMAKVRRARHDAVTDEIAIGRTGSRPSGRAGRGDARRWVELWGAWRQQSASVSHGFRTPVSRARVGRVVVEASGTIR